MPNAPIIAIQVDDKQFKEFYSLFSEYQEGVDKQSEAWKKSSSSMNEGLDEAIKHAHKLGSGIKGAGKSQSQFDSAIERGNRGLKTAAHTAQSLYHTMNKIAKTAIRFGAGLFAFGAAGGFGFDRLARAGVDQVVGARSVNSSTGRLQAFQIAANASGLAPENLPASILQGVTSNPLVGTVLAPKLGMSPSQMQHSTVEASLRMVQFAHDYMQSHKGESPYTIQQQPIVKALEAAGLNFSQLTALGNTAQSGVTQFKKFVAENAKALQLQSGTAIQMAKFRMELGLAGSTIETALINRLKALGPSLGITIKTLADRFVDLINVALSPKNIAAVKSALDTFSAYLGSKKFASDLQNFENGVGAVAKDLVALAKWLGKQFPKIFGGESPAKNLKDNLSDQEKINAVYDAYSGGSFLGRFKSYQSEGRMLFHAPQEQQRMRVNDALNGLPLGTLAADAISESGGDALAINGNAQGMYQLLPAARKRYGVTNAFMPPQATRAAGKQLAQNLATARALAPLATTLQHLQMMKAANYMGDQGFMKFWMSEKSSGHLNQWLDDMPKAGSSAVSRFIKALPADKLKRLRINAAAGQLDEGASSAAAQATAASDMRSVTAHLASIDRKMSGGVKVTVVTRTPVAANLATQANGVQ